MPVLGRRLEVAPACWERPRSRMYSVVSPEEPRKRRALTAVGGPWGWFGGNTWNLSSSASFSLSQSLPEEFDLCSRLSFGGRARRKSPSWASLAALFFAALVVVVGPAGWLASLLAEPGCWESCQDSDDLWAKFERAGQARASRATPNGRPDESKACPVCFLRDPGAGRGHSGRALGSTVPSHSLSTPNSPCLEGGPPFDPCTRFGPSLLDAVCQLSRCRRRLRHVRVDNSFGPKASANALGALPILSQVHTYGYVQWLLRHDLLSLPNLRWFSAGLSPTSYWDFLGSVGS